MIRTELSAGVARLWLARPLRHNAFDAAMLESLDAALVAWADDLACRVIVLGAEGPSFCAGADVRWMAEQGKLGPDANRQHARRLGAVFHRIARSPKPVVARVQGPARGGGVGLVAACDIVVAGPTATFGLPEVRLGLIPAVISPFVIERLGPAAARAFFLTGEAMAVDEARRLGLVHRLADAPGDAALDAAVDAVVAALVLGGPEALAACKRLVAGVAFRPFEDVLDLTADLLAERRGSAEAAAGMAAFAERRRPDWSRG